MSALLMSLRTAALDTSNLADLSRDFYAKDPDARARARAFLDQIQARGFVPLLTMHHVEELLKHENLDTARARLRFLESMPVMAWVRCRDSATRLGSIVDILASEVREAFLDPEAPVTAVRDRVASQLFGFGSGADALADIAPHWEIFREEFRSHEQSVRGVVAISRSNHNDVSREKLSSFLRGKRRTPAELASMVQHLQKALASQIAERGDPRIVGSDRLAADFMREVMDDSAPLVLEGEEGVWRLLEQWLIYRSDCTPETTMGDVSELSTFRKQLQLVNHDLQLPWNDLVRRVSALKVPSWLITRSISKHRQNQPRHEGGELNDSHLAVLAAYADFCTVDKRTHENLRRCVSKDAAVKELLRSYTQCGRYQDLPGKL